MKSIGLKKRRIQSNYSDLGPSKDLNYYNKIMGELAADNQAIYRVSRMILKINAPAPTPEPR